MAIWFPSSCSLCIEWRVANCVLYFLRFCVFIPNKMLSSTRHDEVSRIAGFGGAGEGTGDSHEDKEEVSGRQDEGDHTEEKKGGGKEEVERQDEGRGKREEGNL